MPPWCAGRAIHRRCHPDERAGPESTVDPAGPVAETAREPLAGVGLAIIDRRRIVSAMATREEILRVGDRDVTITNPDKVFFPEAGHTKLDLVRYYLAVADGALVGAGDRPMAHEALRRRRGRRLLLPEARPGVRARPGSTRSSSPSRRVGRPIGGRRARRGGARLGRQPRLHRPQPPPGPGRRPRPSRRAAGRPRPGAGRRLAADPPGGARHPGGARGGRPRRLAEDLGLAGHPHQRPHRAPLDATRRSAGRPSPWPATSSGGPRRWPRRVVEGGAPRGVPRLQPERQGPDGRLGLLGPPDARRARLDAAALGRGRRRAAPRTSRSRRCRRSSRERGDAGAGIDAAVGSLEALLELSARHEAEGMGDAPWPPNYRKQEGEPPRVMPSRQRRPAAEYDTPEAEAEREKARAAMERRFAAGGRGARRRSPARRPTPTGRRRSSIPVIEIARAASKDDALAGLERWRARWPAAAARPRAGRRARRFDAWPVHDLDPHPGQPDPRRRGRAAAPGSARPGLRPEGRVAGPGPLRPRSSDRPASRSLPASRADASRPGGRAPSPLAMSTIRRIDVPDDEGETEDEHARGPRPSRRAPRVAPTGQMSSDAGTRTSRL